MKKYQSFILISLLILTAVIVYLIKQKQSADVLSSTSKPVPIKVISISPRGHSDYLKEYHFWLEIPVSYKTDYEVMEINGYTAEGETNMMTKVLSKTIDLTQSVFCIAEAAKILPTRINSEWHSIYAYKDIINTYLFSVIKPVSRKCSLSLTLTFRDISANLTHEITLPIYTY